MSELTCIAYVDGVFYYAMVIDGHITYIKEFTKNENQ